MNAFVSGLPKAELHLHLEGSLEPEQMFMFAKRNQITIPFESVEEVQQAYQFANLQEFLDIYFMGMNVLIEERDFYQLTEAYLRKVSAESTRHVEVFFDPQGHTERGIPFETAMPHLDKIDGVGLDSSEMGNPPSKFKKVFAKAKELGLKVVAHAGEEGPADYVWQAIDELKVDRIDHGNRSLDDEDLVHRIVQDKIGLTVCPLSNLKLCVVNDMHSHPLKSMLDKGIVATINSDDPSYFGGYINENYLAVAQALNLSEQQIVQLAKNSFTASFLPDIEKQKHIDSIDDYVVSLQE